MILKTPAEDDAVTLRRRVAQGGTLADKQIAPPDDLQKLADIG